MIRTPLYVPTGRSLLRPLVPALTAFAVACAAAACSSSSKPPPRAERVSVPVRDVALSPDNKWCAVASDELTVKLVSIEDNTKLLTLKEHGKPTKHLSFDPKGSMLALSCTDGVIYVYSMTAEHPELIRKVDGVIGRAESESEASCRAVWHPDGRAFAAPTPTR